MLDGPLKALTGYRQFVLWKTETRNGKQVKLPVSPWTGQICDAHDAGAWVDASTATQLAQAMNMGVGFVFTKNDPFFFVDIDHCLQSDNTWSPTAMQLLQALSGAAVEVSQSGTGLHVIGQYSDRPDHGCKNVQLGIEMYTHGRFVALTGTNAIGDAAANCTAGLSEIVPYYFPVTVSSGDPVQWTTQAVAEWSPIADYEILTKACRRQSGGSVFGTKATFLDLWSRNVPALAQAYPTISGSAEFDESSADAALAQHLAYWCGKNCEMIRTMMNMSALRRDKYDRKDYLPRTITRAVANQKKVYTAGRIPEPHGDTPSEPSEVKRPTDSPVGQPEIRVGLQMLTVTQQLEFFKGCVYIQSANKIYNSNDGTLLDQSQFRATFGGYQFAIDNDGKCDSNAWKVFTESRAITFPRAHAMCFRPELPPGEIVSEDGQYLVNTYVPIETARAQGDPEPFLHHLRAMLPDERDQQILLAYMAAVVQYPGVKFQWAPLLQGCEGNGKTLFVRAVERAVGSRYTHYPNASDMGNNGSKFNAWIQNKLFIGVEEIYVSDRREVADALKPLLTNDRIEIQGKGQNQVTGDNRANFMMCTNYKDAVLKTVSDRRYCILYTAQQSPEDMINAGFTGDYFPNVYNWLNNGGYAIVNDYLRNYQIPDELNPATMCHRAPETSSTAEAIKSSLGPIEQEVLEAVDEGRPGFAGGWVSSMALDKLLDDIGASRRMPRNKRKKMLEDLGYMWHPSLTQGRVNNVIPIDGGKPRLFIKKGHIATNLQSAVEVSNAYAKAQGTLASGDRKSQEVFRK